MRRAAPAFEILMLAPVRRFFPEPRQLLNGSWRCSRVCTPPRISPSCPHYVPLWLGRSTIVRGQDHCEAACQSCFWMDGYRSSPSWAVFMLEHRSRTGGLRASSESLFLFRLVRLMSFSRWICTFQAARGGLKKIPSCGRQRERAFYAVFSHFFRNFLMREILREREYCFPYPILSKSDCVKP